MVRKIYVETMQDMTVCRTGWRLFSADRDNRREKRFLLHENKGAPGSLMKI